MGQNGILDYLRKGENDHNLPHCYFEEEKCWNKSDVINDQIRYEVELC